MVRNIMIRISIGAVVALGTAAMLVASGPPAAGSNGDPIIAGAYNTSSSTTYVNASGGNAALYGIDSSGIGVVGEGTDGVHGSGTTYGVVGLGDTAVFGSGTTYGVHGQGATGVYGYGSNGNGVWGQTSGSGTSGVYGENDGNGYGVAGSSAGGVGVLAQSGSGTALQVTGTAAFSRSGKATVTAASGKPYVQVSLGNLTSSTFVVATVQGNPAGIWVKSVAVTPASSYFRIYLNKVPTKDVRVGWFVLG